MLKLLADENFPGSVVRGLWRLRPELDIVRVQDVGLISESDPAILEWAASEGRVLISLDSATVPDHAYERLTSGLPMTGVLIFHNRLSIREMIEELIVIDECSVTEDWNGRVVHLPD